MNSILFKLSKIIVIYSARAAASPKSKLIKLSIPAIIPNAEIFRLLFLIFSEFFKLIKNNKPIARTIPQNTLIAGPDKSVVGGPTKEAQPQPAVTEVNGIIIAAAISHRLFIPLRNEALI